VFDVPVVIGGEMGRGGDGLSAFGQLLDSMEDRHEIDVGEGELVAGEMAGLGDRSVENPDLLTHRRQYGFDRRSVRLSIGGFRRDIRDQIGPDQRAVHHRVDERDPLLGESAEARIGRENQWSGEAAIQISRNGLRFEQLYIAVS